MATRRTPFGLFDEMEQMMAEMRRSMLTGASEGQGRLPAIADGRSAMGRPAMTDGRSGWSGTHVSVETEDDGYVVLADMPGFETSDIDLRFDDGRLTVDATHTVENESEHGATARSRSMHETVRLPGEVLEDEITATYRNGVLEIRVPTLDAGEDDADEAGHRIEIE